MTQATDAQAPYLATLNPVQRQAVETTEGPLLVLAGAGTGKTRVLTTRIAHLITQRLAFPGQILAVTFTNKAASEMKQRVASLLGIDAEDSGAQQDVAGIWLGTFHSIAAKILRRHAEAIGLTSTFTILDEDDQIRLLKTLMNELGLDAQQFAPKALHIMIQQWKDRGLTPDKLGDYSSADPWPRTAYTLYIAYQKRLKTLNAVDFADLLLHNLALFTEHTEILNEYARRFKYVLVDEYQDTNVSQYLWLRLLAVGHKNLCCVGDDDQSIYGWRGAEVGNILKFENDFPGAQIIRLEQNYRSTKHILGAASGLIANNRTRLGKTLWTEDDGGDFVKLKSVWDDAEEARFVGEEIESLQRGRMALNDMAILVRAGFQTRAFEERFITLGVPYRVVGGLRFYERLEVRDAVAYLRLIAQPHDDLAFERIINTPKRGVGKATMEQLHTLARARNQSLSVSLEAALAEGVIKGKVGGVLGDLMKKFERWRSLAQEMPPGELADLVIEESGYRTMWQQDNSPESPGRLENLKELVRALGEFSSIVQFLEHVGLVSDTDKTADGDMVSLMTLHAAKGLEFRTVFLTGWEEGLFPHQRALDESGVKGLEEERRLAYVGITRARQHLYITHAANRRIYNQWQSSQPSRFLTELPDAHITSVDGPIHRRARSGPALYQQEIEQIYAQAAARSQPAKAASSEKPAGLRKGDRVQHEQFGFGVVLKIEDQHVQVAFKDGGIKKLLSDYVSKA